jgi:hypothetical protein
MTGWQVDQLGAIDQAAELQGITVRADGTTRRPVPIWVVRVGDGIYVRSYRGDTGAWYRHARADKTGRVRVPGLHQHVRFDPVTDRDTAQAIDAAYAAKYARYGDSYLTPMVAPAAQAATLRRTPTHG